MAKTHTHTQSGSETTMTTRTTKTKDEEEEAMDTAATCEEEAGKKKSVNRVFFTEPVFLFVTVFLPDFGLSTNWDMADVIAEPNFLILIFLSTIAI